MVVVHRKGHETEKRQDAVVAYVEENLVVVADEDGGDGVEGAGGSVAAA